MEYFAVKKRIIRSTFMFLKTQQERFDDVKWFDSIREGNDTCGSYAFCVDCRKEEKYPCARAMHRHANGYIRIATIYRHA